MPPNSARPKLTRKETERLISRFKSSRSQLSALMSQREQTIEQVAGSYYTQNETDPPNYVNFLSLAVDALLSLLSSNNPKALVLPKRSTRGPSAADRTWVLDQWSEKMALRDALRKIVLDSILLFGFCRDVIQVMGTVQENGQDVPLLEPVTDYIPAPNAVLDFTAKSLDEMQFVGHVYEIDRQEAIDSGRYPRTRLARMEEIGAFDSEIQNNTAQGLNLPEATLQQRFKPQLRFVDIYIIDDKALYTFDFYDMEAGPLYSERMKTDRKWGPYDFLYYTIIADNLVPKPLVAELVDMAEAIRELYEKVVNQALDEKNLVLGRNSQTGLSDLDEIKHSQDGDALGLNDPDPLKAFRVGGISQPTVAGMEYLTKAFMSRGSGFNWDLLLGLRADQDTLGQSNLLASNSANRFSQIYEMVALFVGRRFRFAAEWYSNDPALRMRRTLEVPALGLSIERNITPETVAGEDDDFLYEIVPYSLGPRPPEARLQRILGLLTGPMAVFVQLALQKGAFDFQALIDDVSLLSDLPELPRYFRAAGAQQENPRENREIPRLPAPQTSGPTQPRRSTLTDEGAQNQLMNRQIMGGLSAASGSRQPEPV